MASGRVPSTMVTSGRDGSEAAGMAADGDSPRETTGRSPVGACKTGGRMRRS